MFFSLRLPQPSYQTILILFLPADNFMNHLWIYESVSFRKSSRDSHKRIPLLNSQSGDLKIDAYLLNLESHDFWRLHNFLLIKKLNRDVFWTLKLSQSTTHSVKARKLLRLIYTANLCFEIWIAIWMDTITNIFLWISRFTTIMSQWRGSPWYQV